MSVKRALMFAYAERYGGILLALLATMVLSRLLTPAEVGIFSIGMLMMAIAGVIRDLDASAFIIQTPELTNDKIRAAFTVSVFLGVILGLLFWFAAPLFVDFYHEPKLGEVIHVLAFNFILVPFGANTQAILTRHLHFGPLASIRLIQPMVAASTSITLAWNNYGTISLAWGVLAGNFSSALLTNFFRPPGLPFLPGLKGIKEVLDFGLRKSFASILEEINKGAPEVVLGKTLGFTAAGLFSRANGLAQLFFNMVMRAILQVSFAHFAKDNRERQGKGKEDYLFVTAIILGLSWPFFFFLGWYAKPILLILYGSQWIDAASALRILCLSVCISLPFLLGSSFLVATGGLDSVLKNNLIITPIQLALISLSALHSTEAVAWAIVIANLINAARYIHSLKQYHGIQAKRFIPAFSDAARLTFPIVVGCGVSTLVDQALGFADKLTVSHYLPLLLLSALLSGLLYLALLFTMQHPIRQLLEELLNQLSSRRHRYLGKRS